jgi:D-alanyl-D-alanine endopeptidase (penicillin-binding protein 7)
MTPARLLFALATMLGIAGIVLSVGRVAADNPAPLPPAPYVKAAQILEYGDPRRLALRSEVALILDEREGVPLYEREIDKPRPIASLTKLMTALVLLESEVALDEPVAIVDADRDRLKGTRSRLPVGTVLSRIDLLRAALGASDNRAAAALARSYPGGSEAFIAAMNTRAQALGMTNTKFADASGLNRRNVSTARDLARLVAATRSQPLIELFSTTAEFRVFDHASNRPVEFVNTNRLVRNDGWDIHLSKTGYTADAGNCLVMQTTVGDRPLTIVLLNSWGKLSKYADATRIRDWLLRTERRVPLTTASI